MDDHMVKGHILAKKAENKLHACCPLFASKVEDAALLFHKSATSFKLAKSWDKAGSLFVESSACHMKSGAVFCLNKVVTIYEELGRHIMAAKYSKEIGDLCELNKDIDCARLHYERAAELFEIGEAATSVIQCKLKVAQFFVQLQQYQKAIKIYEDIARQSLNSNLLKYGVRVHLLNSGLCQLVKGDFVAISNSLELYQDLDPTFSTTREYKFLADLAASIDEEDVEKFTRVVKEFNDITPLGL